MTISEFNTEFGVNTWGYPKYKMVSKEDIGTYVAMQKTGQTIPYFCVWEQRDEPFSMGEGWTETIKIIQEKK